MKWAVFSILAFSSICFFYDLPPDSHQASVAYQPQETGSPLLPSISSDWVATDGAGRILPTYNAVGGVKQNKYVGMFYFLVHGQYNDKGVYDISAIKKANPKNPQYGPEAAFHWWGQPEVGYFKADDPWVIRRNLQLLAIAGIDILFFDTTNGDTYLPTINKLCEISLEMRRNGIPTPYICFVTYANSVKTITTIYQEFYAKNKYSDLWFRWQGKPLLLGKIEDMTDPAIRDFFTWRFSWAWTNARNDARNWQWLDRTPQNYGWDKDPSIPEEIPVSSANHPYDNNVGKSFQQGQAKALNQQDITAQTPLGLYFEEQWKRALQVNPAVVFVTGWNEWIAQRAVYRPNPADKVSPTKFIGKTMEPGQTFFIDLYNEEYNRDLDPMKGGYTDNYYYQLIANIRRFKGMLPPSIVSPARTIAIDGQFNDWATIKPDYTDPKDDVTHRNWPRADNKLNYINNTGRNDIVNCRVTSNSKSIFFYARTSQKLTSSTGKNWMLLFIDADQSAKTGWVGYDYLISQAPKGNKSTINRWNGKIWMPVATGLFQYSNNQLEISVPLSGIHQLAGKVNLDFHWADNIQKTGDISEFFLNGDSAPDRRFNYRYSSR